MTTTIINLYGGSGVGKSTVAALLFARMKIDGLHVELVREYVKLWAWGGRKVRREDQIYLLGKQSAYESVLYGKVDYIVTDSPVLLAGMYAEWHNGEDGRYVTSAANSFIEQAQRKSDVKICNYLLQRVGAFDPRGRWETAEEAERFDKFLEDGLTTNNHSYTVVSGSEEEKVASIMQNLDLFQYGY
jgi:ABC-type amino acid transport substrate-binding protein